ncbi:MAG TPA: glycoside hydrolase family 2 TIM barrel-domain containing protein [Pyrinomonadaceae bacterium]|nr:glycoside hydrolase family 2 TIM barrel-domain containing protein [Pyrinomonadaceae bacterium]
MRRTKFIAACAPLALCLLLATSARASARHDLNGEWQFVTDPSKQGEARGWHRRARFDAETVRVPHTWNVGKYEDYEGTAWYFKSFAVPAEMLGRHVELNFGATFYRSRVWLNGTLLGGHEGGHTAYSFDLTPHLRRENFLAVEIDNMPTAQTIPGWALRLRSGGNIWYDWWHYGGIVRDVWLSASGEALVRRQQIRVKVSGGDAEVTSRVFLENFSRRPLPVRLIIRATPEGGGDTIQAAQTDVTLKPGAQELTLDVSIRNVKLWHFDRPNLYRMEVELRDTKGKPLDSLGDTFGARTLELRGRHLYLNGERVRLSGMTRHEDSPWEGLAETRGTIKHDYDALKELQVTFTRPVHYPQHPDILDYCDRNGILLVPEIPIWQFNEGQLADPKVVALARKMMREMIEQNYNHPSVMGWSVCNESETHTAGGRAYVRAVKEMIDEIDPDRFVTFADDSLPGLKRAEDSASSFVDFIMWNQYFGTWSGPASLLPETIERVGRMFPDKMIVISEFGAARMFARDKEKGDELRRRIMRDQMALFSKHDFIGGLVFWCYQDYKSHRNLRPGMDSGFVEMGVVDENRQRYPSFNLWKELNAPARVKVDWNPLTTYTSPAGFRATIERRGPEEIPSYALRGYRLAWEVFDYNDQRVAGGEQELPEVGATVTVEGKWAAPATRAVTLRLRLYRPTGFLAQEETLEWWQPLGGGEEIDEMRRKGTPVPE